jgi:hypothetical protein
MIFKIPGTIFLIVLLVVSCLSQTQSLPFTSLTISRNGYSHLPLSGLGFIFDFRFLGLNTDVNGGFYDTSGINLTEININCCIYGKRLVLSDLVIGRTNFRQENEPVIVNGTAYNTFYYRGAIIFTGSTIVPFNLKKKQTQQLKFQITTTGYIRGYVTFTDYNNENALFSNSLNMNGVATITIRRHDGSDPVNHFDIVNVKYDLFP